VFREQPLLGTGEVRNKLDGAARRVIKNPS
jgi:hypothetical protein